VAQEPSLVRLPDRRLFCVMDSIAGHILGKKITSAFLEDMSGPASE